MASLVTRIRQIRELLRDSSGQATAEYVMTTTVLLIGGLGVAGGWPFFSQLMSGYNSYLASIHFVLNMALP